MEATYVDEEGKSHSITLDEQAVTLLSELKTERLTEVKLQEKIRNLDVSADAKLLISEISNKVISVGDHVINIGKKILEIIFMVAKSYPNTLFGLLLGVFISLLISSIPLLGIVLGPFVGPIAIAFTLASGYVQDLKNAEIKRTIQETMSMFEVLKEKNGELN